MKRLASTLVLLILFTSCAATQKNRSIDIIGTLTGKAYAGRLVGTEGNTAAGEWLAGQLEALGVQPLVGDSLLASFSLNVPQYTRDEMTLKTDTSSTTLLPGVHYVPPAYATEFMLQGIVKSVLDGFELQTKEDETVMLFYSVYRASGRYTSEAPTSIHFTDKGYALLEEGAQLHWETEIENGLVELDNVIGILHGEDSTRAVILGAHFDHMGQVSDLLYTGAVDNASGVSAVLETAQLLAGADLPVDVVICFWNSEEYDNLAGSRKMAMDVTNVYTESCYINIDCVGEIESGPVYVTADKKSSPLAEALQSAMAGAGYTMPEEHESIMVSDHINFSHVSAVNICQDWPTLLNKVHMPTDTADKVDTEKIAHLAAALASVIQNHGATLAATPPYTPPNNYTEARVVDGVQIPAGDYTQMTIDEQWNYRTAVLEQLGEDEFIFLTTGPESAMLAGIFYEQFDTPEAMHATYPLAPQVPALNGFSIGSLVTNASATNWEPDIVMKRDKANEQITSIVVSYISERNNTEAISAYIVFSSYDIYNEIVLKADDYTIVTSREDYYEAIIPYGNGSILVRPAEQWVAEDGRLSATTAPTTPEKAAELAEYVLENLN